MVSEVADTNVVGLVAAPLDAAAVCVGAPPVVSTTRRALIKSDEEADLATDVDDASDPKASKDKSDAKSSDASKRATRAELEVAAFGHCSDGFGFCRVDKLLRALADGTPEMSVFEAARVR